MILHQSKNCFRKNIDLNVKMGKTKTNSVNIQEQLQTEMSNG